MRYIGYIFWLNFGLWMILMPGHDIVDRFIGILILFQEVRTGAREARAYDAGVRQMGRGVNRR